MSRHINMFARRNAGLAWYRAVPFLLCAIPSLAQFVPDRYILLLDDPPVASRFSRREEIETAPAMAYRNQVETRQRRVRSELASRNIQITGSVSVLLNAIFVNAPSNRVSEMLAIPGVVAAKPMRRYKPTMNRATQQMRAPAAWTSLGGPGNAGTGMKIAILDSGIDQNHPAFQDSSLTMPAGFPKCTNGHPEDCAFTNSKVIVARSYVRQLAGFTSKDPVNLPDDTSVAPPPASSSPDDYMRDRLGHGTMVASAAAANQNTGTVVLTGMAPKAYLGNYKIAGTPGVDDGPTDAVLILAINDALLDGMQVASLSWGSQALTGATDTGAACGNPAGAACDPVAFAFENAAKAGLVITVAAGNSNGEAAYQSYPYFNSISSPSNAPSVIGVGATLNSHVLLPTVSVNAADAGAALKGIPADTTDSFSVPSSFGANAGTIIDVTQLGNDGYACSALPAGLLSGAFALIQRGTATAGTCFATDKATNAQLAGAVGVIFYLPDSSTPTAITGFNSFLGPVVTIGNAAGLALKSYIGSHPIKTVNVTIDLAGRELDLVAYNQLEQISPPILADQLASYSSFGPTPDGAIKPDLVATGGLDLDVSYAPGLYLATQSYDPNAGLYGAIYSANGYTSGDGTSFAAPIVAGAAALVKQAHPTYSVAEIKSALVNSAAQDTTTEDYSNLPVDAKWLGAGRLDAGAAASSTLTIEPATISLGYLKSGALPIAKVLKVTNKGTSSATVAVVVAPNTQVSGITVAVDQPSLTLPAGASATVTVTLSGSVPASGSYSGKVTLTASGITKNVPYLFLVPDGVPYNIVPLGGPSPGTPGTDAGSAFVQVIDQYGVPVTGTPVIFSAAKGVLTFNSVQGEPACSPANTNSVTCNTDNYGFAYAEVTLGQTAGTSGIITVKAAGISTGAFSAVILPQPAITAGQILDNASFQGVVSPGSIVAIKGTNLMDPANLVNTSLGYDVSTTSPYPLVLDGVNVSFDVPSKGISVPAPIVAVSAGQVNVQVPWELAGQTSAQVKVIVDQAVFGSVATATLSDYTPAFFTPPNSKVADALDGNYQVITSSNPAIRGQFIALYANSLGPVTNTPADGAGAGTTSTTTTACTVTIGGIPVTPVFCGLAPGFAIYQVNVQVPASLSAGNQSITISVGGQTSPSGIVIPVK